MPPCSSYCTDMYLPKRELLSLRIVFALPNASSTGDASRSSDSTWQRKEAGGHAVVAPCMPRHADVMPRVVSCGVSATMLRA